MKQREDSYSGCWRLALDTQTIELCPRARQMLDIPEGKVVTLKDIAALVQPGKLRQLIRGIKFSCATDTKFEVQTKITTSAGAAKWLLIAGVPYYPCWGTAEQMAGVLEDRSQSVDEECLSLAVVNHELRSPLTTIKLNVQMLINKLRRDADQHPVQVLRNVDLHVNCMASLIEEYLSPAVNEDRKREINFQVFDLDELATIITGEMKTSHPAYHFSKCGAGKILVKADKYKIVQVLINYLTNAVKFSPVGSQIMLTLSANGSFAEVAIKDQGKGIPAGLEQRIFRKFFRCDTDAGRGKNSKGLGLYLVKKIIDEHGGAVKAGNNAEGGAVFYFSLPIYQAGGANEI